MNDAQLETVDAVTENVTPASSERCGPAAPCPNCGHPVTDRYCGHCGQSIDTHRHSLLLLLHDLFTDILNFDSRILRTGHALLFIPGELALAFRQGRTQPYVPAVRLYLFVSLLFFLTLSLTHIAIVQLVPVVTPERIVVEHGKTYAIIPKQNHRFEVASSLNNGRQHYSISTMRPVYFAPVGSLHSDVPAGALKDMELRRDLTPVARRTLKKLAANPAALNNSLTTWIPRALFLLLPLFALLLAIFHRRSPERMYFVDHLVFSLGFHTFAFALLLVAAGLAQMLPGEVVALLTLTVLGVYLLLGMRRFYCQSWRRTTIRLIGVATLYTAFCVFPAFMGILVASILYG